MRNHDRVNLKSTPLNNAIGALDYLGREVAKLTPLTSGRAEWLAGQIAEEVAKLIQLQAEARDHEKAERDAARFAEIAQAVGEASAAGFTEADMVAAGHAIG